MKFISFLVTSTIIPGLSHFLTIDLTKNDVTRSNNGDNIGDLMVASQPVARGQMSKTRSTNLETIWLASAIRYHINTEFTYCITQQNESIIVGAYPWELPRPYRSHPLERYSLPSKA